MTPPLPAKRFSTLLADPSWRFRTWDGKRGVPSRQAEGDPYPTLTLAQLKQIRVQDVAARDAVLFMWVLESMLDQALELGRHWGFRYKTVGFVWLKADPREVPLRPRIGLGHWSRKQGEQCLLFTRGQPPRMSKSVPHVIIELPREHSRKPDVTFRRIEQLVGGPYLELFARQRRPGWEAWGDQVDHFEAAA